MSRIGLPEMGMGTLFGVLGSYLIAGLFGVTGAIAVGGFLFFPCAVLFMGAFTGK
jgi:hypothetical protein